MRNGFWRNGANVGDTLLVKNSYGREPYEVDVLETLGSQYVLARLCLRYTDTINEPDETKRLIPIHVIEKVLKK